MPIAAHSPSSSSHTSSIFRRPPYFSPPTAPPPRRSFLPPKPSPAIKRSLTCKATLTTDVSPSSSPESVISKEAEAAAGKIGAKIRVKAPVKIFHVAKAPGLDLEGKEGVIKQYVGFYKGKRVSANLPFKIEFFLPVEGQEKPIKFFAHLREDEFEVFNSDIEHYGVSFCN